VSSSNRPFKLNKRRQLFVRSHAETLSIIAVRVCNPDCPPPTINGRNAALTLSGFAEIVSDDLPVLHAADSACFALLSAMKK
jgi:hypothetical protein